MNPWEASFAFSDFILDMAVIGFGILAATILRKKVKWIQNYLIPNNIIAGLFGLLFGILFPNIISVERMGTYVYHLLGITFIALALTKTKAASGMNPFFTGMLFISSYLIQGIIGMVVTLGLIFTVMPDLFPGFGMLLPLGLGMGPGIAYAIGHQWEMYGFTEGGIAGLSVAAVGFGFAYIHGIYIMRLGIRNGLAQLIKSNDDLPDELRSGLYDTTPGPSAGHLTSPPEAIESLTLHWSIIGLVYGVTWLLISGAANALSSIGAQAEVNTLWSFHFIFCSVTGILARQILEKLKVAYVIDEGLMTRTSNLLVDIMITASLAGITLAVVGQYLLPLVLTCVLASVATYYFIKYLSQRLFKEWVFERFLSAYAVMTGTIQSGLVILRVLDPNYKSNISIDLVHASGFALILGFPLLFLINAPVSLFEDYLTGYIYSLVGMVIYALMLIAGWVYFIQKNKS